MSKGAQQRAARSAQPNTSNIAVTITADTFRRMGFRSAYRGPEREIVADARLER